MANCECHKHMASHSMTLVCRFFLRAIYGYCRDFKHVVSPIIIKPGFGTGVSNHEYPIISNHSASKQLF